MVELLDIFWALIYIVSFFGSLSFGYLVLRFNIPDIRIVPREAKMGLSGIIGIIIFLLSFAVSYFVNVSFLIVIPLWTVIFTALFMAQQAIFSKKEMTIAIPIAKLEAPQMAEKKVAVRPRMSAPKVLEERQISERGAFIRESYPEPEKMLVEQEQESQAAREIVPEDEQKYIQSARDRYKERMEQRQAEEQERKAEEKAAEEHKAAEQETGQIPIGRPMEESHETGDRRKRYMERRGEMIEEAKTDMFQASERKDRERYEKELFKESAPSPEISIEELSKGLDVGDLETLGSINELGDLGLGDLDTVSDRDLAELAGIAEAEKVPRQKGLVCPKCRSSKSTIVYCPYCGKGFCSNCSDKVMRRGELIFYGCPICKKDVIVKAES